MSYFSEYVCPLRGWDGIGPYVREADGVQHSAQQKFS